jgi:hypothetical protein
VNGRAPAKFVQNEFVLQVVAKEKCGRDFSPPHFG